MPEVLHIRGRRSSNVRAEQSVGEGNLDFHAPFAIELSFKTQPSELGLQLPIGIGRGGCRL